MLYIIDSLSILWSWRWDSNPRPADYKSAALPTELHQQRADIIHNIFVVYRYFLKNLNDYRTSNVIATIYIGDFTRNA
jgi:hypothetical protein